MKFENAVPSENAPELVCTSAEPSSTSKIGRASLVPFDAHDGGVTPSSIDITVRGASLQSQTESMKTHMHLSTAHAEATKSHPYAFASGSSVDQENARPF